MRKPPHDSLRFGQRGRQELRVDPQYGKTGTQFHFNAFRFDRRKSVRVVIQGPGHFVLYSALLTTDDDGSIGYVGLTLTATNDWPLGTYTFSVDGIAEMFVLTR
jgi:hypothetical protein